MNERKSAYQSSYYEWDLRAQFFQKHGRMPHPDEKVRIKVRTEKGNAHVSVPWFTAPQWVAVRV